MKALTYHGPHHVQVENVPDPGIEQADDIILPVQRPDREHFLPERDVGRDKSMLSCNLQRQFKKESVFKGSYHSGKTGGTTGFGRIPGVQ